MNVLEFLGIKKPTVLNQYQSPVNAGSPVPMSSNVVPLVKQPVVLPNAPKAAVTSQAERANDYKVYDPQNPNYERNQAIGKALLGFGKGLLSTGYYDSPLAAGLSGALDGYGDARGTSDERMVRAELEAAYQTGDQGKIALARSKYQALPNYNKDVLAGLEAARNESISGIKQESGYVYDPKTGTSIYRDPTGDLDYQVKKVGSIGNVNTDIQVDATTRVGAASNAVAADNQTVVGDIQVSQELAKRKGMTDEDLRKWRITNPVEFEQQMDAQRLTMKGQEEANNRAVDRANMTAQQSAAKPLYTKSVEAIAAINDGIAANAEAMALVEKLPSNLMQTVSDFASPVIGSDSYDAVQQYKSVIGKAALALHTGGVMTDKDYERYVEMAGNPKTSPLALQQLIAANIDRSKAIKQAREAERDMYGGILGYNTAPAAVTKEEPKQTKRSDSGGNTAVSGSSW